MSKFKTAFGIISIFVLIWIGIMSSNRSLLKAYSNCCQENLKECLACQAGKSITEICSLFPGRFDCSGYCCNATRRDCLACWEGVSVEDFCIKNPGRYQCNDKFVINAGNSNEHLSPCCKDMTKECLACTKNITVTEFCDEFSGQYGCDMDIMIGIVLSNDVGYTEFTASVWRRYHNVTERHIHLFKDASVHTENDILNNWYGSNIRIVESTLKMREGENVKRILEYFTASEYNVLLLADVQTIFLSRSNSFIKENILKTDGFLSLYHSSVMHNYTVDCQAMVGDLCVGDAFGTYGVAMTKNFAEAIREDHQSWGLEIDWGKMLQNMKIRSFYPPKSLCMQIGQINQSADHCGQNKVPYRFNRCELPQWIKDGVEFYFDRCTSPNEHYDQEKSISNIESEGRYWTRPVISYSLYGSDRRYTQIARENARRVFSIYPGWKIWIYTDGTVPAPIIQELCEFDIKFIDMSHSTIMSKMSWRFLVASEPVKMYAIRDIDSWLLDRGKAAVDEWIASGRKFHNMRDHPNHSRYPMSGGMWGGVHDAIPNMKELLESRTMDNNYMTDMNFLNNVIWKTAIESVWTHDSHSLHQFGEDHPFPTEQKGPDLFVGNVVLWKG